MDYLVARALPDEPTLPKGKKGGTFYLTSMPYKAGGPANWTPNLDLAFMAITEPTIHFVTKRMGITKYEVIVKPRTDESDD